MLSPLVKVYIYLALFALSRNTITDLSDACLRGLLSLTIQRTPHLKPDMKLSTLLTALCATSLVSAFPSQDTTALSLREAEAAPETYLNLEKRKGGGGGKGGGKGGSSSGSSSGGKPASSYSFSPSSNAGGRTISGSGLKPSYSGGRYVGGK